MDHFSWNSRLSIVHTVSKFINDHMCFQLYMQVVKIYLHSIFLKSVIKFLSNKVTQIMFVISLIVL